MFQKIECKWTFKGRYLLPVILVFFLCSLQQVDAQNKKITGVVLDELGEPLIGANISILGTSKGTITDVEGRFVFECPSNSVIKVSYIGFLTKNIKLSPTTTTLKITLIGDSKKLDDVVVTALGISRESKSLSYARQSVDTETMTEARDGNLLNMLAGKSAGLQVISGSGPLSSTRVVIRGNNSLTGNNQPLYVVDGVPIMNEMGLTGDIDYGNAASNINPDDVENIEILKGANASALYGSDAANGVVLITTKKATRKKGLGVSYSTNYQISQLTEYPDYQNVYGAGSGYRLNAGYNYSGYTSNGKVYDSTLPWGIADLRYGYNQRSLGLPMLGFDVVGRNGEIKSYSPQPNNVSDMYITGGMLTNSLSVDKVLDKSSFRLSFTNTDINGILKNFNIQKKNVFSLKSTIAMTDYLSIDANVRYTNEQTTNRGFTNASNRNPLYAIAWMVRDASISELVPWKKADGTAFTFPGGMYNPYWLLNELSNEDSKNWLLTDLTLNFTLSKTLKFRLRGSTDVQMSKGSSFTNYYTPFDLDGEFSTFSQTASNTTFEGLLTYNKRWKNCSLSASAGANNQVQSNKKLNSLIQTLLTPDIQSLANNGGTPVTYNNYNAKHKESVFSSVNLGLQNFLYLDLTARNDWSSTLPLKNNSYFYHSQGLSFLPMDALKMKKNNILTFAKLRASRSQVGNDTGFDMLQNGYTYGGIYLGTMTWYQGETLKKNPNLKPESTTSYECGADLRFWDNRLSMDATYYTKSTKNQIVQANVSAASGYNQKMINAGEVRNSGFELNLSITPIKTKNFQWISNLNWAKNNSLIVSLVGDVNRFVLASNGSSVQVVSQVGKSYASLYGLGWKTDDKGNYLVDANGQAIQVTDKYIGKVEADWTGSWKNSFRYKNFDLSILFDVKSGGKVFSGTMSQATRDGQTVISLEGRDEYLFSDWVLGENTNERKGFLDLNRTVNPNANLTTNTVPYKDNGRLKGVNIVNRIYDSSVAGLAGQVCNINISPQNYWMVDSQKNASLFTYDASFIKLREIAFGYSLPKKILAKTPLQSFKVSAVGRNIAILFRNTPNGIDPESSSSTGNGQGLENGFAFPTSTYGFNLSVTF